MFTQPLLRTAKTVVISIAMAAIIYRAPTMYDDGLESLCGVNGAISEPHALYIIIAWLMLSLPHALVSHP